MQETHHAALVANGSASSAPQVKISEDTIGRLCAMVRGAVQNACYMVHSMGEVDPEHRGMSTTASVVQFVGELIVVGQVGDSRVYLARDGAVTQLTEDHTWLNLQVQQGLLTPEQARGRAGKNIITRAVGLREFVEVDILVVPVQPGDRLLLCSDGLSGMVEDAEILELVKQSNDIGELCTALIAKANEHGGEDNVTAVVIKIEVPDEPTVQDGEPQEEVTMSGVLHRDSAGVEDLATRETALPDPAPEKTPRAPESK